MNRTLMLCVSLVFAACGSSAFAGQISDTLLGAESDAVLQWFSFDTKTALEPLAENTSLAILLSDAEQHVDGINGGPHSSCSGLGDQASRRACNYVDNIRRYRTYVDDDQTCRIGNELASVNHPEASAGGVTDGLEASSVTGAREFTSQNLFQVSNIPDASDSTFPIFAMGEVASDCTGMEKLLVSPVRVPETSSRKTDKLILAYTYVMSLVTWEYNRPYALAAAERIRAANERWAKFETNVIHDQFPWETLFFNDWLAGASTKFRGTLTHPPTRQIRALHPVPTGILDVDGDETLFRPRVSIEVLGIRHLNEGDYTPKRAYSIIATLQAEADEEIGWGILYTWKRGSIGIIRQEQAGDDVIGVVFGIDLANQIDSKRNELMENWQKLRDDIDQRLEQLP